MTDLYKNSVIGSSIQLTLNGMLKIKLEQTTSGLQTPQSSAIIPMKRSQIPCGYDVLTVNITAPAIQIEREFQPQLLKNPQKNNSSSHITKCTHSSRNKVNMTSHSQFSYYFIRPTCYLKPSTQYFSSAVSV